MGLLMNPASVDRLNPNLWHVSFKDAIEAGTSSSSLPISFTSGSISESAPRTHINFFQESESGNAEEKANEERKKEEKEEQQKWERKVGISVALGQTPGGPLDK